MFNIVRKATKLDINPTSVVMESIPDSKSFVDFIWIEPISGEVNAISFSKSDLNEPFISYNKSMWSYLEPELNKRLSEFDIDNSVSKRVRSALSELLPASENSIEEVEMKLSISKRTLQRKLSEKGQHFKNS